VFDPESAALLEGGCALIVGSVDDDGAPLAGRGWGLTITDEGPPAVIRLLLGTNDPATRANLESTGMIAVTGTDVPTLRSVQLKGRVVAVEAATDADVERAGRYIEALFDDIEAADGSDRTMLRRWIAPGYAACIVEVHERFDQTPGPGAGAPIPRVAST
jgi:hypothetical protein